MALTVSTSFDNIEVIIPAATGNKTVTLSLPSLDCFDPKTVEEIETSLADDPKVGKNPTEALRFLLTYFATNKAQKEAIAGLNGRQINEIDKYWQEESGITVGES